MSAHRCKLYPVPRAISYKPLTMSSKPFTRSMAAVLAEAQAHAAQAATQVAALTQARVATQAQVVAPTPVPFYEEQEIHEIANELEARIRAKFEKDLATARQQMIDAMMKDRSQESGYMEVHISLEGAYDHKRDIVWVKGEEEDICEFCGKPREEEPAPAPAPACTFPQFKYKSIPLSTRRSMRLLAKTNQRVVELVGGVDNFSEWKNTVKSLLFNAYTPTIQGHSNSYEYLNNKLDETANVFTFLSNSPHTKTILKHYREMRTVIKNKADQLYSHTIHIRKHMDSSDCACYSNFTPEQREAYTSALTKLRDCCCDVLVTVSKK